MNKKNIGIVGCGKWGKVIIKELKKICNIKFIYNSKNDYKKYDKSIDWIFILTPNNTHFKLVKFFLKKKINVFSEKPLTYSTEKAIQLLSIANKNNVKLYISDIEKYKRKRIHIKKINTIIRTKMDVGTSLSLLDRLAYHDFYLIKKNLNLNEIISINVIKNLKSIKFNILLKKNLIFKFCYDINNIKKEHCINSVNFY
ncbi:Gfo/Idh/MocA family oxidoreductase, partial [Candidatus Pelagibacter sp.]|nr:Gfo/Idh/MocA family oxidoreductase [Candidatus Pelagibacter sp.]